MRGLALILGVAGLGLVIAAVALAMWAQVPGDPFAVIGMLLLDADPIGKLALLIILGSLAFVVVSGGGAFVRSQAKPSEALTAMAWLAAGIGVLWALYGALNIRTAMVRTNTTNLMVIAPSVAEVMLIAGIGLLVGGLGLGIHSTLAARVART